MSKNAFSTLNLKPELVSNLETMGYESMTPIQSQSLPHILAGKDVIAQGKTGSGKTAAFGLGLLDHLNVKRFRIQSLVLCPTRELADQVAKEIRKLARSIHNIKVLTLCGGMPFGPQIGSLEHGAHIIVGTPGRVEEHLRKGFLSLDDLNLLVLDEADRMLEMGFQDALDAVVDAAPADRQTLLFSATYPKQIESIAREIMHKPVMVKVESTHDENTIDQHFYHVDSNEDRLTALRLLLSLHKPESSVVFCNTKREAQEVSDELEYYGFSSMALHGDLEQRERDQTLVRFANKSTSVLVATDVAARGLDIEALDCVINYHLARDTEVHVHRIGRTGRAGSKGVACSFISDKEHYKVALLEDYLERDIVGEELPSESLLNQPTFRPVMTTLQILGGKKQKVRPGDILGALTGDNGIRGDQVGKINVFDMVAYVAVKSDVARVALKKLENGKMKGRSFRVRILNR
ncbi:ATP-dependent RNA helicase DbpA [Photobacterium lutimaris]|uniref:ATP-dependent RNA helicase DbpA n=1 Tax=Photobacterium lutimaris TaxID=388278 RepID=A0A2T3J2N9_9GAMM|nr:ATP-dependent RNA helicase DbpA [Photobacterium lutimaris]PSU35558.1 ATP-dependent RNA helicase DbpA [Photobacterium lutimaris]TDR78609.1 ATP-dependent RNA helicase DbpA [Photobacterium lutimaris]